jgi:uncharacterized protein involved in response to NO
MMVAAENASGRERKLQALVTAYIVTGLFFLLLPGTFLGVWNLISISNRQALDQLSRDGCRLMAMRRSLAGSGLSFWGLDFIPSRRWATGLPLRQLGCLALWTAGLLIRWSSTITSWHWKILVPFASALELTAFLIFFRMVSRHRPAGNRGGLKQKPEAWMLMVIASTVGFLLTLTANAVMAIFFAVRGEGPALPHGIDQEVLIPALSGYLAVSVALMSIAAVVAIGALHVWDPSLGLPKTEGIHPAFPLCVRGAYGWLAVASVLSVCAYMWDRHGGIWGASRHALTVGFLSTMVFAIGQRILPAFCGIKVLFSKRLMFASLLLLNAGCLVRVAAEIPAYEGIIRHAWFCLPISRIIELTAVTLFAANLSMTFIRPAARLTRVAALEQRAGA